MIAVDVRSNISRVSANFSLMTDAIEEKAAVRAINRAGDQAITAASREIRGIYNISAGRVRAQIKVRDRARKGKLNFTIRVFSKRIPLVEFSARQTQKGVTVSVRRGGARKLIPHAFITTMGSGHKGVFVRAFNSKGTRPGDAGLFRLGKGSRKKPWPQSDVPIAELFSLDVPRMFLEKKVREAVVETVIESFERNFQQQLTFLSGGSGGG